MKRILFFLLLIPIIGFSQQITISGTILDNQKPLPGVSVIEKGTTGGTSTDFDGNFQLDVSPNATLVFSFVGFETQEIVVGEKSNILNIKMKEDAQQLDEVVVEGFTTIAGQARKRRESIQDTPEAVTALSSKDIEVTGIGNIEAVAVRIPNVSFNDYQDEANFAINIRGITQVRDGDAPVSIVIDDVQLPFHQQLNQDFFDIEHVEVVKGPQGTLYGKNAIGGAINIITKKPTNDFHGLVRAGYSEGSRKNIATALSGAIVKDRIYFRVGGDYTDFDGYDENKNTFLDKNPDFKESKSFRGQLHFKITPKLSFDLKGQISDSDGGALYYIQAPFPPASIGESAANQFDGNPRANILGSTSFESSDISGKLTYRTNFGKFLSITNLGNVDYDTSGDLDHTETPILWQSDDVELKGFNQEIRFISNFDSKFSMITGLFYQNNNRDQQLDSGLDIGNGVDTSQSFGVINNNVDSKTIAVFGHFGYKLTEKLEATAGLRYDADNRKQEDPFDPAVINEEDFNQLQPKLGLSYRFREGTLIFANYGEGYRSGGFNALTGNPSARFLDQFKKEETRNIELGFKSSWWNNRLLINGNLFRTAFDNEQVYVVDLTSFFATGIFNIDEVVNYGAELELKVRPIKNLDLGFGLGLTDSEIKKADIADRFPAYKGADPASDGANWVGNKAPFVSAHNILFSALYTWVLNEDNNMTFYADYSNNGKFYWHPDNFDVQDPYSIVNFNVTYNFKKIKLGVHGNNIFGTDFNSEYFSREFSGADRDLRFPGNPANYGVSLSYKF